MVSTNSARKPDRTESVAIKAKTAKGDTRGTDGNKDWSSSYGITWDDSSQGAELYATS